MVNGFGVFAKDLMCSMTRLGIEPLTLSIVKVNV